MSRRILLLITDLKLGGTPTVVRELAIRLRNQPGVHVHVACLDDWGPVADQISQAGTPVTALGAAGAMDLRIFPKLLTLIRSESIDTIFSFLIHANTLAAAVTKVCRGVRNVQSIQTTQPRPAWHWRLQSIVQHAAEKIIVPSPSVAAAARDWAHVDAERIAIIPNAIDVEAFKNISRRDATASIRNIGFIGRLDPIKRVGDLIAALPALDGEMHLHIFGQGAERGRIEQQIRSMNLQDRVTLHGAVSRPQEALAQIDLLVLPSQAEGFGLVLIEAMAAAVPVVATNVAGIRDVVMNGVTGLLVPPGNPGELSRAIQRVSQDVALRDRLVDAGRRDVIARFSWGAVMDRYCDVLEI